MILVSRALSRCVCLIVLMQIVGCWQLAISQTRELSIPRCTVQDIDIDDDGLIEICSLEGLNAIRYQADGSGYRQSAQATKITTGCADDDCRGYELTKDLDFADAHSYSSTPNQVVWTQAGGWQPIGDVSDAFGGVFEANGYTISNLFINRDIDNVALFARTASKARINGANLVNINITGRFQVGGLVGFNQGIISNSSVVEGRLTARGDNAGGLVGANVGPIINSHTELRITGNNSVGGLAGNNGSRVFINNRAAGTIEGSQDVGGLVGTNRNGEITNSYATGGVRGESDNVGGLVGSNDDRGRIINSYATGGVRGDSNNTGGLVGSNDRGSRIINSYATGDVRGESNNAGGLVGKNNDLVINSYAIGSVSGNTNIGGLIGFSDSDNYNVVYSYWDISTSLVKQSNGGIPQITERLQSPTAAGSTATEVYYEWSRDDWDFGAADQYPLLKYTQNDDLLSGQYTVLSNLVLLGGATLSPNFNVNTSVYDVVVDNRVSQLELIPFLRDEKAEVRVTSNRGLDKTIASGSWLAIPLNPSPEATLIKVGRQYRINVAYGLAVPIINVIAGSDNSRIAEGETITLAASVPGNRGSDSLNYRWTQLSDKPLLSDTQTNEAVLEITVPEDFVSADNDESTAILEVELSHATMRTKQRIALTIIKINNDLRELPLATPAFSEAILKLSAPEVDNLLMHDADGSGDLGGVGYQWQYKPAYSTQWSDAEDANEHSYIILPSADLADFVLYRVRVAYTDGQGYRHEVASKAYTFIKDIDKDDDGFIDIDYLEDLDAIRYQLDGGGYSSELSSAKLTAGCPAGECRGYELTRDLDFQDDASYRDATVHKSRWSDGEGWQPIGGRPAGGDCSVSNDGCFSGIFRGNNYTIANLMINRPLTDGVGLFGFTNGSTIRNIGLINVDIRGGNQTGGLVGHNNENDNLSAVGQIINSYVVGSVVGRAAVGGLVGLNNEDLIEYSFVIGDIVGRTKVGGLVGHNQSGRIEQSYAEADVTGHEDNIGGLVGLNNGSAVKNSRSEIRNSYAVASVVGRAAVGGLVGYNSIDGSRSSRIVSCYTTSMVIAGNGSPGGLVGSNVGIIRNSYSDTDKGPATATGGGGRTTMQLKSPVMPDAVNPATYTKWNTKVWDFGTAEQYPTLKLPRGDLWLPVVRYGLRALLLSDNAIWNPAFEPTQQHYVGTVINDSDTIYLTAIALQPTAQISIYVDGKLIDDRIAGSTTSQAITLHRENATEIIIEVAGTDTLRYTLKVGYQYVDIDADDDGFIDISTLEQLNAMRYQTDGSGYKEHSTASKVTIGCPTVAGKELCIGYELVGDLDFNDAAENGTIADWQPIGTIARPLDGNFRGNGHNIYNLTINRPMLDHVGLFGVVDGTIESTGLVNVDIVGGASVGALAGLNRGMIRNSFSSGRVSGGDGSLNVGGLVGHNASTATVVNSYTSAAVQSAVHSGGLVGVNDGDIAACYASGSVSFGNYSGGLVGRNKGTISHSYAIGNVEGTNQVGGFVAWNDGGRIINSYAVGVSIGVGTSGGFAALNISSKNTPGIISNSYWDRQTTGQENSDGGSGFNTITLKNSVAQNQDSRRIYYGWDENIWQYTEGVYPLLKYTEGPDSIDNPACTNSPAARSTLPRCGAALSGQRSGLADLSIELPDGIGLSPTFRRPLLDYHTTVYNDTYRMQITPTAFSSATVVINSDTAVGDFSRGSGVLSEPIPLHRSGETLISINVNSESDYASLQYQITVGRFDYLSETVDIDADDDGLIEIGFLEGLNAMRYQLDGSGYREKESDLKITKGCDEDDTNQCNGYELVADLDFNDNADYRDALAHQAVWTASLGWAPIGYKHKPFVGKFNGNGRTISNLKINRPNTTHIGLFGVISKSKIENIGLVDVDVRGIINVGALAGKILNSSEIIGSYASGRVSGAGVGGLVGENDGATIINSHASAEVYVISDSNIGVGGGLVGWHIQGMIINSYASGRVSDADTNFLSVINDGRIIGIGGLVGFASQGTIINSYASGDVEGGTVGGLVGDDFHFLINIINSYSSGKVSASIRSGGLVGNASEIVTKISILANREQYINSYWDKDVSGIGTRCRNSFSQPDDNCFGKPVALPRSTVALQNPISPATTSTETYYNWNTDSWDFGNELQYPALKYIKGSDGSGCRDAKPRSAHRSVCGTLLPGQRIGLSRLEFVLEDLIGLDKISLSPEFRKNVFDYSLNLYPGMQKLKLIAIPEHSSSTIHIGSDGDSGFNSTLTSGDISSAIPLKLSGETVITVDVDTEGDRSVQYRIAVSHYDATALPEDIDIDNDGLIEIYFLEELDKIRFVPNGNSYYVDRNTAAIQSGCPPQGCTGYELIRDLDFNDNASYRNAERKAVWTRANGWSPLLLSGTFNGNGYIISNLMINRPTNSAVGLFSQITMKARVENIGLTDVDIIGGSNVGGLIGENSGTIKNSFVIGKIASNGSAIGGLIGGNNGAISNSYANVRVEGGSVVGGLVGHLRVRGTVENSYAVGNISGDDIVGGFVGDITNITVIRNNYAIGKVEGMSDASGFAGRSVNHGSDAVGNYWDIETSGVGTHDSVGIGGAKGFNTQGLQSPTTPTAMVYTGWDTRVWYFGTDKQYPVLKYSGDSKRSNTLLAHQYTGLVALIENARATWSPVFDHSIFDYKLTVYADTTDIQLTPTATDPNADIRITNTTGFNQLVRSATMSAAISLNTVGTTVITIDVGTLETEIISYHLHIERLSYLNADGRGDVDKDDDGLIELSTPQQLNAMRYRLDGRGYKESENTEVITIGCAETGDGICKGYELSADIDFAATPLIDFEPIGTLAHPFSAVFNGNNKTISNLVINKPQSNYVALFGVTDELAQINSVGLINVNVVGNNNVGSLVGFNKGGIANSYAAGVVSGNADVGGLLGHVFLSTDYQKSIVHSYTNVQVVGKDKIGGFVGNIVDGSVIFGNYATGDVGGINEIGGFAGRLFAGEVQNNYATGDVGGINGIGGFFGKVFRGEAQNNYAVGNVTGITEVGGFIGDGTLSVDSFNYWNTDIVQGDNDSYHYQGFSTEILQSSTSQSDDKAAVYYGWDEKAWSFSDAKQYPYLLYKKYPHTNSCSDLARPSELPVCGTLLSGQRGSLADLQVNLTGLTFSPEFQSIVTDYKLTIYKDTDTIQLIPIAYNSSATIAMYSNVGFSEQLNSGIRSAPIVLNNVGETTITMVVQSPSEMPMQYHIAVYRLSFDISDIDQDNDGLIEINTIEDLNAMRYQLDGSGYRESDIGSKIILGCGTSGNGVCNGYELSRDLDFNNAAHYRLENSKIEFTSGEGWLPIGDSQRPFTAIFKGNGKVISNLFINRPDAEAVALFGATGITASIESVGLFNINVRAKRVVGGLVGVHAGDISKAYTSGTVEAIADTTGGGDKVGGLVGEIGISTSGGLIADSYAYTRVVGKDKVGGLVGNSFGHATSIRNSYVVGAVNGSTKVGGLVGNNEGGTVVHSYWNTETSRITDSVGGSGRISFQLQFPIAAGTTSTAMYYGWSTANWDFGTSSEYPVLKEGNKLFFGQRTGISSLMVSRISISLLDTIVEGTPEALYPLNLFNYRIEVGPAVSKIRLHPIVYSGSSIIDISSDAMDGNFKSSGSQSEAIPLKDRGETLITISVSTADITEQYFLRVVRDVDDDDDGLIEIGTAEQFKAIRYSLDGSSYKEREIEVGVTFGCGDGVCKGYELIENIDLKGMDFNAIGTANNPFIGMFEGNGHTISNLVLDKPQQSDVALFAHISNAARINSVGLLGVRVKGDKRVGALVATNKGTISNSYVVGEIVGNSVVGGLVGSNQALIINGYASGSVAGESFVGGLVGVNELNGSVHSSFTLNDASGIDIIGALVGSNRGTIADNYATGRVQGSWIVGGLVGENVGTISNSYATASVVGVILSGGLIGENSHGLVTHSYWDIQISGINSSSGGLGFNTEELKSQISQNNDTATPYYMWSNNSWNFGTTQTYPILKYTRGNNPMNPTCSLEGGFASCAAAQSYGLISLNISDATIWSQIFEPTKLHYQVNIDTKAQYIHLTATALADYARISIVSDSGFAQHLPNGMTSAAIPLNPLDTTVVTVDVLSNRAVQYKLDLIRLPVIAADIDIDDDDDGLIEIYTLEDVNAIRYQLDGSGYKDTATAEKITVGCSIGGCRGYELMRNLDFSSDESFADAANRRAWTNGAGWQPIGDCDNPFRGIFNGNGHYIANLTINRPDANYVAMFGCSGEAAVISEAALLNIDIIGNRYVGALVGANEGEIKLSYAFGTVESRDGDVGGVSGTNRGTIATSYADVDVKGDGDKIGGLVGWNRGMVVNSYASGDALGSADATRVGGLVGDNSNRGSIVHSYAIGGVAGHSLVGGLVGFNRASGTITYSYWDSGSSSNAAGFGIGLATTALKAAERPGVIDSQAYFQWDDAVWDFGTAEEYPALKYTNTTLLPLQRNGLLSLELSAGAKLFPTFSPSVVNYQVLVNAGTTELQITPTPGSEDAVLNIYRNAEPTETLTSPKAVRIMLNNTSATEIVIAVLQAAYNEAFVYKLIVNHLVDIVVAGRPENAVDEGDTIRLDGTYRVAALAYAYNWEQISTHYLPPQLDMNQAVLEFKVPENLVPVAIDSSDMGFRLTVSAGNEVLVTEELSLMINKVNNGVIPNPIAKPLVNLSSLQSPQLELLSDPDGGIKTVAYQWQLLLPDATADWIDLKDATRSTYAIPATARDGSRYRLLFSYIDGQGYIEEDLRSEAYVYADLDKDDDGLIEIHTLEDLQAIRYQLDGSGYKASMTATTSTVGCPVRGCNGYELADNLDFNDNRSYRSAQTNKEKWTSGAGWQPIHNFNVLFKGNGYTISNLYIYGETSDNVGLFGMVLAQARIEDIGLLDVAVVSSGGAGSLVGFNRGMVVNSYASRGSVEGTREVGGLVGRNHGVITNSYAVVDVGGPCDIGGLVGYNAEDGNISNSYAAGVVTTQGNTDACSAYAGGLVGNGSEGTINYSYAASIVSASRRGDTSGGLVAKHNERSKIGDSYWDRTINADISGGYGISKTTAELQTPTTATNIYARWSSDDWDFGSDKQYPALKYRCDTEMPTQSPKCGNLLPGQGVSSFLAQLILSSGISLEPNFDPFVFYYRVRVADFNSTMTFTPYAANINTKIRVTKNGEIVVYRASGGETISMLPEASSKTTIVIETLGIADGRGIRYTLNVNIPPLLSIPSEQQNKSVDEGDALSFSVEVKDTNDTDTLYYSWTQLSGPPLLSEPQNDKTLTITIPHAVVARDESSGTAILELTASDGLATDRIKVSLKISKKDNDFITALQSVPIWSDAYTVSAPDIDLSDDSDGVGDTADIAYRWQEMTAGTWQDIVGRTAERSYRLPEDRTNGSLYRVIVSYKDGQGYAGSVNSSATAFEIDIDRDGDGLIEISDIEGLNAIRYQLSGSTYKSSATAQAISTGCAVNSNQICLGYELSRDLDFDNPDNYRSRIINTDWTVDNYTNDSDVGWQPIGTSTDPFTGIFDGNGHTISNLRINRNNSDGVGLFGDVDSTAELYGVGLLNVNIVGNDRVGALVGSNNGRVSNSYANGAVVGSGIAIGGLIGFHDDSANLVNSYATGTVDGSGDVGGLVGTNAGAVGYSYTTAKPTLTGEDRDIGGLIGLNAAMASIVGSYWDIESGEISDGVNGVGLTTRQLQIPIAPGSNPMDIYHRWDLNSWDFGNQRQYPTIKYKGNLLNGQHVGLFDIALSNDAVLFPTFDPKHYNYSVTVHTDTQQLRLTPIANDPNVSVVVNDSFEVASGVISRPILLQDLHNTAITLSIKTDSTYNEKPYTLNVNNRFPRVDIDGIPQQAVDEGTIIVLDVFTDDADGDRISYRWSQTVGPDVLSGVDNLSGIIKNQNDADLSFNIADDLLDATQDQIDIELVLTLSDGKADINKKVPLTINKHNRSIPDTFFVELIGLTYEAAEIDISLDPDGVHPMPRLNYQWQYLADGQWFDIVGAVYRTYTAAGFFGHQHRVLIGYVDGQNHEHTIISEPQLFVASATADIASALIGLSVMIGDQIKSLDINQRTQTVMVDSPDIAKVAVIVETEGNLEITINGTQVNSGESKDIQLNDSGETIISVRVGDDQVYIVKIESPLKIYTHIRVLLEGLLR